MWRRAGQRAGGSGAGREPQPPGPTAGASRAASAHSWKSCARTGALGPALGEIGSKARARPCAWEPLAHAPPQPTARTSGWRSRLCRKGLRLRDQSAQQPGGAGGAAELAERPKPGEGGEGMSANPCALLPARAPVLGSREGGRRVCVSGCPGDPRLPGSPWRAPAFRPGPGDPLPQHRDPRAPPAHFAKARKRPSRRQRNSNLLHSRLLRPPQTLPGALPRPRRRRARTGRGREAGWASLLPYAGQLETASAPGPGTSRGSRAPALRCADSPGPPAPPPGIQIIPHLSGRAIGGRGAHTKRLQGWIQSAGVEEIPPGLGTGPGAAIYLPDFFFEDRKSVV